MNIYGYIIATVFIICMLAIYIEKKLNYPFGFYDGIVLCPIPPFVKRVRSWNNRWIGFDKKWKFVFLGGLDR